MTTAKIFALTVAAATVGFATDAAAQYFYQLPNADFKWNWGEVREDRRFGHADIDMTGGEANFDCQFTLRFRPTANMTVTDIRNFRDELGRRLDFIYAVSEQMYYLEQNRDVDWATLDCKKFQAEPKTADEIAERQNEARDKMLRELERRRARARDND
jgi:hypothetical protein